MKNIPLVDKKDFDLSQKLVDRLLNTPLEGGILFVGIKVEPEPFTVEPPLPRFHITIGCDTNSDPIGIIEVAKMLLSKEVESESQLRITAIKGKCRK